jgi:hypothetical protein
MAAFHRGFLRTLHQHSFHLPSSIRTAVFTARPQPSQSQSYIRNFASSAFRRHPAPARYQPKANPVATGPTDPILRSVVQTRKPVLLYKEPSRRRYLWRVYAWAAVVTGTGLFNFYWARHTLELPGLAFYIPPIYIIIGVIFVGSGIHLFQRPVRRISTLELIPGTTVGRLQLRLIVRQTPWSKKSVVIADTWEPTISDRTNSMILEMREADRARKQSITDGLGHMFIVARGWEIAARWLHQKWTSFFLKFKFAILQFGIAEIDIDGVKWKVDCEGWLLEDGKGKSRYALCT